MDGKFTNPFIGQALNTIKGSVSHLANKCPYIGTLFVDVEIDPEAMSIFPSGLYRNEIELRLRARIQFLHLFSQLNSNQNFGRRF